MRLVEMGWNVVLGDPIRKSFGDDNMEQQGIDDSNDDMYMDDELDEDESDLPSTSTQTLKRRRAASGTPHLISPKSKSSRVTTKSIRPPSLEQIEYTSLLSILIRFPSAPLLSSNHPQLTSALLDRLRRFINIYPTDTSMHHDYILSVSATLSHVALNKKADITAFACGSWNSLVGLWGTKNKRMKEALLGVLRVLFPFYIATEDPSGSSQKFDCSAGISKLWHVLNGEAESRWGVDGLSLDSLRLEVISALEDEDDVREAFVKDTFRAGWHFDAGQALAWSILELQADCAGKVRTLHLAEIVIGLIVYLQLFQLSESLHSGIAGSSKSNGKRTRLENPVSALLHSIQNQTASIIRAFHIQILLFFVGRYWCKLHESLKQDVLSTLLQFITIDDGLIQSWTFLCFAAIAYADILCLHPRDASTWDPIWAHAIRRANAPTVCRAACHTAHTLLFLSRSQSTLHAAPGRILTSHHVLLEIETFAKDLDVQGPLFPYDSVCLFLAGCLRLASQDMRLYRMQLEDKAVGWLLDCWRIEEVRGAGSADRSRMSLHMVKDILLLLESICGVSKRSDLVCRVLLPECLIVETMVDEMKTKVIRDFLLSAKLPRFRRPTDGGGASGTSENYSRSPTGAPLASYISTDTDLSPPRGRERKLSAYMLKSLEALIAQWEALKHAGTHSSAEKARRSLDAAVIALSFESLLVLNGTRVTRRVVQCACKLVGLITAQLTDLRWTIEEKVLILLGLEPLISNGEEHRDAERWEAMIAPNKGTGIKTETLRAFSRDEPGVKHKQALLRDFQRIVWRNVDVSVSLSVPCSYFP